MEVVTLEVVFWIKQILLKSMHFISYVNCLKKKQWIFSVLIVILGKITDSFFSACSWCKFVHEHGRGQIIFFSQTDVYFYLNKPYHHPLLFTIFCNKIISCLYLQKIGFNQDKNNFFENTEPHKMLTASQSRV